MKKMPIKKTKKKSRKSKEIDEPTPKMKVKKRKAELLIECFGSDSDNENKRRKVQEKACTVTSKSDNVPIQEKSSVPCNNELMSNENVKLEPNTVNDLREKINTKSHERADTRSYERAESYERADTRPYERADTRSNERTERNQWSRPDYRAQSSWYDDQPVRSKPLECY